MSDNVRQNIKILVVGAIFIVPICLLSKCNGDKTNDVKTNQIVNVVDTLKQNVR